MARRSDLFSCRKASQKPIAGLLAFALVGLSGAAVVAQPVSVPATTVESRNARIAVEQLAPLDNPWGMTLMPDGGVLITEKPGRLRIWRNSVMSAPIAGVPRVAVGGQGGLLDVILDPGFAQNGLVYLSFAEPGQSADIARDIADPRLGIYQDLADVQVKGLAVMRARLDGTALRDVRIIWRAPKTIGRNHFGGRMAFAADGSLLVTSGDRQRFEPAQDPASTIGKIIRVRTDGSRWPDNPTSADRGGDPDIWSSGHRNPLGIAIRPGTQEIWLSEMGPLGGDEINVTERGGNYGWPLESPGDNYDGQPLPRPLRDSRFIAVRHSFNPAISPSSLMFYTGAAFPEWNGHMLIGGLSSRAIVRGIPAADGVHDVELIAMGFRVRDIEQMADGHLLVLKDGSDGGLFRLTRAR